jgi:hypothetical protein
MGRVGKREWQLGRKKWVRLNFVFFPTTVLFGIILWEKKRELDLEKKLTEQWMGNESNRAKFSLGNGFAEHPLSMQNYESAHGELLLKLLNFLFLESHTFWHSNVFGVFFDIKNHFT